MNPKQKQFLNKLRRRFILGLTGILAFAGGGCFQSQEIIRQAHRIQRDSQLTCSGTDVNRCAIPSQYQDLADHIETSGETLHYVSLFDIGEDELLARIHLIRSARRSIILQTFIYEDDEAGRLIFRELLAAACRGVKVRLILDQFGTYMSARTLASMATAHANLDIKFFAPIMNRGGQSTTRQVGALITSFNKLNERMHNKLFAVDGRIGIVGGRNIKNTYFDYGQDRNFKDLGMLVIGPAVDRMYESFEIYWRHEKCVSALDLPDIARAAVQLDVIGGPPQTESPAWPGLQELQQTAATYAVADLRPSLALYPARRVEYIADWPVKNSRSPQALQWDSTERIEEIILSARDSIIMQTPYLIREFKGIEAFVDYRHENEQVDLALSTNSLASSDIFYVYALTFKQRHYYLEQLNSRLFEFKPRPDDALQMMPRYAQPAFQPAAPVGETPAPAYTGPDLCLHAKFFVVDDFVSYVGSHNFDPRSNHLNTENGLIVWDEQVTLALHRIFDRDTAPQNSWVAAWHPKHSLLGRLSDTIAAVSSSLPVLDLWPFYYSNSYDLKQDGTPLPAQHPQFYEQYRNVGAFPRVGLLDRLTVRLSLAFVGLGRGFL